MKRLALILVALPFLAQGATLTLNGKSLTCSELRMGKMGNAVATCESEPPRPTQPTFPTPTAPVPGACANPAGQLVTPPGPVVMQTMYMGGTNNYAIDDVGFVNPAPGTDPNTIYKRITTAAPAGSTQAFTVPKTWPDGSPATSVSAGFADWLLNGIGVQYEVALSTCPGDFSYYKTAGASVQFAGMTFQPCGVLANPFGSVNWSPEGSFLACKMNVAPNATWYLNWRIVPSTGGGCADIGPGLAFHTCGNVFSTTQF